MTAPTTPRIRDVAIPPDHGGWGLTLEPVVLGLMVSPSATGIALGTAALAAFLFRTPFKIVAGDFRRGRSLPRTGPAVAAAALYGTILLTAVAVAIITADHWFWPPLAAAVPLMALQVAYDIRSRSRRLIPEIAGPIGIGSVAAAIALAGGASMELSLGLWLIVALRSIASVVLVRAQLRRARQQPYGEQGVHLVDLGAAAAAITAAAFGVVPWLGAVAISLLTPYAWWSLWRPAVRAVIVGTQQTILGAVVAILTAIGTRVGI